MHRIVLEAFVGLCPDGCVASHLDGDPGNNRVANLVWESPSKNERRKRVHGTATVGVKNGMAKLTDDDVAEIRREAGVVAQRATAVRFGISQSHVSGIQSRKVRC